MKEPRAASYTKKSLRSKRSRQTECCLFYRLLLISPSQSLTSPFHVRTDFTCPDNPHCMHCGTLARRDGIGQVIPPITATLRVPREPLKSPGKSISASPPSRWSANFMVVCVVGFQRLHPRPCEVPAFLSERSKGSTEAFERAARPQKAEGQKTIAAHVGLHR